jgi:hypothetical protein
MNKKLLITAASLVILLTLFFLIRKNNVNIYVGNSTSSKFDTGIDIQIKIDDKFVLADTLYYHPFGYINFKEKLRFGYHTISVSSKKANVNEKKGIFLLFNQFIIVEFYPREYEGEGKSTFRIESLFNPFYYE